AQCAAMALATQTIPFATAISPIYARTVEDFAQSAAFIHEVSGGRFRFGIGVAHAPSHIRTGVVPGKPLGDIRSFIDRFRAIEAAVAAGRQADIPSVMSDRWLADATLFGPAAAVRDGVAAWREAGVTTPIIVPTSASGNQMTAIEEIFAAFA